MWLLTSLTYAAFRLLHQDFDPALNEAWKVSSKRGRKRLMSAWDCLGLVLCYYHRTDFTGAAILVEKSVVLADQQNNLMLDCPHQ